MIVVTGATGTVGSQVVKHLTGKGVPVRIGVHALEKSVGLTTDNITAVPFDFSRSDSIERALEGGDHLFLLTPFAENATEMARRVIDIAGRIGVRHIVRLSAMGADTESPVTLLRWHAETDDYLKQSGIPHTILRPNGFMENFLLWQGENIRNHGQIALPAGEGRVSFIAARDIGAVAAKLLLESGHQGKTYELTGPEAMNINEVAQAIGQASGQHVSYADIAEDAARQAMTGMGMPSWAVVGVLELYTFWREGHGAQVTETVAQITGRAPESFDDWAHDHAMAFKQVGQAAA